jgi:hypothetical protein
MIKRIISCAALSLLLACVLTAIGVLGFFGPLHYALEPGSFLCRTFLSSHFTGEVEGDMITAVIWLNLTVYTLLFFLTLMYTKASIRRSKDANS